MSPPSQPTPPHVSDDPDEDYWRRMSSPVADVSAARAGLSASAPSGPSLEFLLIHPSGKLLYYLPQRHPARPLPALLTLSAALAAFSARTEEHPTMYASQSGGGTLALQEACGLVMVLMVHGRRAGDQEPGSGGEAADATPPKAVLRHVLHSAERVLQVVLAPVMASAPGWDAGNAREILERGFGRVFEMRLQQVFANVVSSVLHVWRALPAPGEPKVRVEIGRCLQKGLEVEGMGMIVMVDEEGRVVGVARSGFDLEEGELEVILAARLVGEEDDVGVYLKKGRGWKWRVTRRRVELRVECKMFERFKRTVGPEWRPDGGTEMELVIVVKARGRSEEGMQERVNKAVQKVLHELRTTGAASEVVAASERPWRVKDIMQNTELKWVAIVDNRFGMMSSTTEYSLRFEVACAVVRGLEGTVRRMQETSKPYSVAISGDLWVETGPDGEVVVGYGGSVFALFDSGISVGLAKKIVGQVLVPWARRYKEAVIPEFSTSRLPVSHIGSFCLDVGCGTKSVGKNGFGSILLEKLLAQPLYI